MIMLKRDIGNKGEDIAVKKLKKLGYKIIERNFSVHGIGEIDIICLDGEYLVFVEVRLRKTEDYGSGAETVDNRKIRKIIRTAQAYMKLNEVTTHDARFDVVSIKGDPFGKYDVEILKNAFET